jgi:menaquinone-dependent protoporphyrinogen oxidase
VVKVLVTAASKYGATAEIARAIGDVLCERGLDASVIPPEDVGNIEDYDAVVLGSAVYTGCWLEPAKRLADRSREGLATRPVWLFSSGPVGDPSRKLVQKMGQDPVDLAEILRATRAHDHRMFAGKLEKKHLSFPQRAALTVSRGLEGDFRDWVAVKAWASGIADAFQPGS